MKWLRFMEVGNIGENRLSQLTNSSKWCKKKRLFQFWLNIGGLKFRSQAGISLLKYPNKMWNLFKFSNKDSRTTLLTSLSLSQVNQFNCFIAPIEMSYIFEEDLLHLGLRSSYILIYHVLIEFWTLDPCIFLILLWFICWKRWKDSKRSKHNTKHFYNNFFGPLRISSSPFLFQEQILLFWKLYIVFYTRLT